METKYKVGDTVLCFERHIGAKGPYVLGEIKQIYPESRYKYRTVYKLDDIMFEYFWREDEIIMKLPVIIDDCSSASDIYSEIGQLYAPRAGAPIG